MSTAITDLPPATTLTGSESVPIVQNGVTKRAATSLFASAGTNVLTTTDLGVTVQPYDATLLNAAAIGVTVQGYDADLTSWAAITPSAKQDTLVSGTSIKTLNGVSLLGSGDITNGTGDVTGPASSVDGEIVLFNGVTGKAVKSATTSGVLKATSGVLTAAVAGTDYLAPAAIGVTVQGYDVDTAKLDVIQTWTANQTFNDGTLKLNGATSGTSTLKAPAVASTYTHTLPAATGTVAILSLAQTWSADQTFTETTETVYALSGTDIDPVNGAVQTKTISGTTTFTATNLAAGQAVVLCLTSGSSFTVNWPTMTWVRGTGNTAPTLTAYDVIVIYKVGSTLYGAYVGSGA